MNAILLSMMRIFLFQISMLVVLSGFRPAVAGDCGVLVTSSATFMPTASAQMMPDVGFLDEEGVERDLKAYQGQPLLINFWGTWCPPCVKEIPSLDRFAAKMEQQGITVLTPAWEKAGGLKEVRLFLKKREVQHLKAQIDPDGAMAQAFSVHRFPSTALIDKNGLHRGTFVGGVNWDQEPVQDTVLSCIGESVENQG